MPNWYPTIFFFFYSRKPHFLKNLLCEFRWASKTLVVPDSYKKYMFWFELETCYANLKLFIITLRLLMTGTYLMTCFRHCIVVTSLGMGFPFPTREKVQHACICFLQQICNAIWYTVLQPFSTWLAMFFIIDLKCFLANIITTFYSLYGTQRIA